MAFKFPFTNYHELNLTWVLEQLKKLFEESNENVETIESYENRLSAVETELPVVADNAQQAINTANAAGTLAQTAKATADHAEESATESAMEVNFMLGRIVQVEYDQEEVKQQFEALEAVVQNFDGRITQAEDDASEALQEAQSFDNRVNAAINTANNAANTATIAQGIAVNANQNAATALDTAQAADTKADAAQDAAEIADGKAEAAQDAAEVADGKAEAAQDTADQNADNIGNLANLTTTAKNNLVAAINEAAQTGGGGTDNTKAPLIVADASGAIASFADGANNMQIQELVCTIEPVQAGTGDPSPTNIRPISGHNGMTIERTGSNLWDEQWEVGAISSSGAPLYSDNAIRSKNFCSCKGDATYYMSCGKTDGGTNNKFYLGIFFYDKDKRFLRLTYNNNGTVQAPSNAQFFKICTNTSTVVYGNTYNNDIRINYPATFTEYTPYNGISVPVTFPTTIYGGSEGVISGALKSNMALVDMGTLEWALFPTSANNYWFRCSLPVKTITNGNEKPNIICSAYKTETPNNVYTGVQGISQPTHSDSYIVVCDMQYSDAATFKAAMSGIQLCYEVSTPVEYSIAPYELTTLYGANNIWTDVGAIQSCKYPADTKLYIDGKIAELQALILEN